MPAAARRRALEEIRRERFRQDGLVANGKIAWDLSDPDCDPDGAFKLAVLSEEHGEVARALMDGTLDELRTELTQLAACCCAWLEALDPLPSGPVAVDREMVDRIVEAAHRRGEAA